MGRLSPLPQVSLRPSEQLDGKKKTEVAELVGQTIATLCKDKEIGTVVFDRNGFIYHGRVKAVADGARSGGLTF